MARMLSYSATALDAGERLDSLLAARSCFASRSAAARAIESGDVVLVRSDLLDAVAAIELGRAVMRRIRQNIFWAFFYNGALIPVGAGVIYPFTGIVFRPEWAAAAMAFS